MLRALSPLPVLAGLGLAVAASAAGALDSPTPAAVHVRLKSLAMVHSRQMALRDVAEVAGEDEEAVQRVGSIHLGKSPRAGYTEQLSLLAIQRLVRARLEDADEAIVWEGARTVKVEAATVRYDGARVVEAAIDYLRGALPKGRFERIEIEPGDAAPTIYLPEGEVGLRARELAPSKLARGRVSVWIDVSLDGEFYRPVVVPLHLQLFGPALVARKSLPRGSVAVLEDFDVKQMDLAALPSESVDPEAAPGRRLGRPIGAGDVLLQSSLEEVLAVGAGDRVTLYLQLGAVQIESQALALSSGAVGQIVRVKPSSSDAELQAEVLAPGAVKLSSRQR